MAALCRQRLARYKVPEQWAVAAALPANAMSKIIRADLPVLRNRLPPA